jgi:hypothetical protein
MNLLKSYLHEVFVKPAVVWWAIATGAITIFSYVGLGSSFAEKCLIASLTLVSGLVVRFLWAGFVFYRQITYPVPVKMTFNGSHYYKDRVVLLLDKRSWIKAGQLLQLNVVADRTTTPLGLIVVDTFNENGYGQALFHSQYSVDNPETFVNDPSRWRSLEASPLISEKSYITRS